MLTCQSLMLSPWTIIIVNHHISTGYASKTVCTFDDVLEEICYARNKHNIFQDNGYLLSYQFSLKIKALGGELTRIMYYIITLPHSKPHFRVEECITRAHLWSNNLPLCPYYIFENIADRRKIKSRPPPNHIKLTLLLKWAQKDHILYSNNSR